MASSLEVNKMLAAILTAGIIASGTGVISRIIYHPHAPEENAYPIEVTGQQGATQAGGAGAAQADRLPALLASGSAEHGQTLAKACQACHNLGEGDPNKIGPHLYGVLGREIASVSDFSYSDALQEEGGRLGLRQAERVPDQPAGLGARHQDDLRRPQEAAGPGRRDPLSALALGQSRAAAAVPAVGRGRPTGRANRRRQGQAGQQPGGAGQAGSSAEQAPEDGRAGRRPAAATTSRSCWPRPIRPRASVTPRVCKACHNFEAGAGAKIGPDLHGVVGRDIASVAGLQLLERAAEARRATGPTRS